MNKEGITKLIDGIVYYRYEYADFLYQKLEEKDKEIDRLNSIIKQKDNIIEKVKKYVDNHTLLVYTKNAPRELVGTHELLHILYDEEL